MNTSEIEAFLHQLCDLAAVETLPRFRSRLDINNKEAEGFDPVTEADREAERAIRNAILARYPDHGILGEEFGTENPDAEFCWVIDPIDGTRSFISGLPLWGTLIGLYKNGRPIAGAMDQPFTGERFYSNGKSSYLQRGETSAILKSSEAKNLSSAIMLTTTPAMFTGAEIDAYHSLESTCKLARYGTDCYGYCLLAMGQVELVVEAGLNAYDIGALIPIIENAGGIVTTWKGDSAAKGGRILAAANADLHATALAVLSKVESTA